MAGPGGISHPAMFDSFQGLMPLYQLEICLTGLKQQGISVRQIVAGQSGSTFEVMGFALTAEQIIELHQNGKMGANEIKAFGRVARA